MAEYIEREAALNSVCYDCSQNKNNLFCGIACADYERIKAIPAADVRPVVRGKWEYRGQKVIDDLFPTYACSDCHGVIPADWRRKCNYCPNCGADMREVDDEST